MKLLLTGEDGFTFNALSNAKTLKIIADDLHLYEISTIWFRPSFGRGAGVRTNELERGYSGFGESDALLIGKDKDGFTTLVFIESKKGAVNKGTVKNNQLEYQFFLKIALIYCIKKQPVTKKFDDKDGEYYVVENYEKKEDEALDFFGQKLMDLYRAYKKSNKDPNPTRKNGWLIKSGSKDSPALLNLVELIESNENKINVKFYALGFSTKQESAGSKLFYEGLCLPLEIKEILDSVNLKIESGLHIPYRTFSVKKVIEMDLQTSG